MTGKQKATPVVKEKTKCTKSSVSPLTINLLEAAVEVHHPLEGCVIDLERLVLCRLCLDDVGERSATAFGSAAVNATQRNATQCERWPQQIKAIRVE